MDKGRSFILRSWFHSGNIHGVLQQISTIWSHQMNNGMKIGLRLPQTGEHRATGVY
jgi:hypothetical protein